MSCYRSNSFIWIRSWSPVLFRNRRPSRPHSFLTVISSFFFLSGAVARGTAIMGVVTTLGLSSWQRFCFHSCTSSGCHLIRRAQYPLHVFFVPRMLFIFVRTNYRAVRPLSFTASRVCFGPVKFAHSAYCMCVQWRSPVRLDIFSSSAPSHCLPPFGIFNIVISFSCTNSFSVGSRDVVVLIGVFDRGKSPFFFPIVVCFFSLFFFFPLQIVAWHCF